LLGRRHALRPSELLTHFAAAVAPDQRVDGPHALGTAVASLLHEITDRLGAKPGTNTRRTSGGRQLLRRRHVGHAIVRRASQSLRKFANAGGSLPAAASISGEPVRNAPARLDTYRVRMCAKSSLVLIAASSRAISFDRIELLYGRFDLICSLLGSRPGSLGENCGSFCGRDNHWMAKIVKTIFPPCSKLANYGAIPSRAAPTQTFFSTRTAAVRWHLRDGRVQCPCG
jgi:hypothetical protein